MRKWHIILLTCVHLWHYGITFIPSEPKPSYQKAVASVNSDEDECIPSFQEAFNEAVLSASMAAQTGLLLIVHHVDGIAITYVESLLSFGLRLRWKAWQQNS